MNSESSPKSNRLESVSFYSLLALAVLAPLVFIPNTFIAIDLSKTIIIALGVFTAIICYTFLSFKEKKIVLPPKKIVWLFVLLTVSMIISVFTGIHASKSFWGQGFELGTASFILVLFLSLFVGHEFIRRSDYRLPKIYLGAVISFLILYLLHVLRLIFGADFLSLGILSSSVTTLLGAWYDVARYALLIIVMTLPAISFLQLSRKTKVFSWILVTLAFISAMIVNDPRAWWASAIIFLVISVQMYIASPRPQGKLFSVAFKRIAWIPLVATIVSFVFAWYGQTISAPIITKINASYSELSLPWQLTLDVTSGAIKDRPLFGVGPNRFGQAFTAYKPTVINNTEVWSTEFAYGFGLVPTFIVTQGLIGGILWIVWLIVLGRFGFLLLRNLPQDPKSKFFLISSFSGSAFLWLCSLISVPSHSILLFMFILTGIFIGLGVKHGIFQAIKIDIIPGTRLNRLSPYILGIIIVVVALWGIFYIKKAIALSYFGTAVKELTRENDPSSADRDFIKALVLDSSDLYWQGRAEANIAIANKLISSVNASTPASTSQSVANQVSVIINQAIAYAGSAVAYDNYNYYNYVSAARVSEVATNLGMEKGYETAVQSYNSAIKLNSQNPYLYLSLARLQASQNKLDDALKSLGSALQIKNNYLEAIFALSQVEAARGNIKDAIIAAEVATKINPNNPIIFFQLGLLHYNNQDYRSAVAPLAKAVSLQNDYANAQYFLGLAYARIGKIAEAIAQFTALSASNPNNQEVSLILTNLRAGRSPFTNAKPPISTAPEKRSSLPLKQK